MRANGGASSRRSCPLSACAPPVSSICTAPFPLELATQYNTLEALQENEQVQKFVKWVRKQPATKGVKAKGRE
ncbi:hypothetical protein ACINK0_03380 [Deinococcus sp. VB343]|uniref:hypothetical protein n=1 Tax=Deinococcus sp. VB343 TaxID=3385567 RepID=UPI0039C8C7AB